MSDDIVINNAESPQGVPPSIQREETPVIDLGGAVDLEMLEALSAQVEQGSETVESLLVKLNSSIVGGAVYVDAFAKLEAIRSDANTDASVKEQISVALDLTKSEELGGGLITPGNV